MFETQTEAVIKARLLAASNSQLNKNEGGFLFDAISPASIELALAYIELDRVLNIAFAQSTYGNYLDMRAAEHGVVRLDATKSVGQITVTGANGTLVLEGSIFSTNAGVQFITIEDATLSGTTATISIEAVSPGVNGNVPISSITVIQYFIAGITAVTNSAATINGSDGEKDADLLSRLLYKVRLPIASGNANSYIFWSREISGVGDASVIPLWDGNGTVKVVLVGSDKLPVSGEIVTSVENYIATQKPIGASVTVVSASTITVDVDANITLASGYTLIQVTNLFTEKLTAYFQSISLKQNFVSYAKVGALLLDTEGITDYTSFTLDSASINIELTGTEVPVIGTVTLT